MSARRLLRGSLIAIWLAILVVPVVAMRFPLIREAPLHGVVVAAFRPELTFDGVRSEKFQAGLVAWFEQNYGLKPTLVRLDNSFGYRVLGDARFESEVHVNRGGMLFNSQQIGFHNSVPTPPANAIAAALLAHEADVAVRARGKALVVIVIPTKTAVFPDAVSARWSDPLLPEGDKRPWIGSVYTPYVEELRRWAVPLVDGPRFLEPIRKTHPELLYTLEGRHLNALAECRLFEESLRLARPLLPERTIPVLDCGYTLRPSPAFEEEEFDLFRLLNVWGPPRTERIPFMNEVVETVPAGERADVLLASSSFGMRYLVEARRTHSTGRTELIYYNHLLVNVDKVVEMPEVGSAARRDLVRARDLYLVPMPQEYLPDQGGQVSAFFRELLLAMATEPP
jgi:hypothetical protein